jgi:LPXTG-motif cell wall-anchored protein
MKRVSKGILTAIVPSVALLLASAALAQEATTKMTTESRSFEIMSVDGNKVLYKGADGQIKEVVVPPDFHLTVDGKSITAAELKPGMKGTAVITTKTTTRPVVVTEVKDGEVLAVSGSTIIVRTKEGNKKFTTQDMKDRNVTIYKEGAPVQLSQLRVGDRLNATIVTRHPPVVMTERQVKAAMSAPPAPAASAPAASASAPAAEPAPAPAASAPAPSGETKMAKKLPKTGSDLPLVALLGWLSSTAGLGLSIRRRRNAAR